jgi:hypothetical protein
MPLLTGYATVPGAAFAAASIVHAAPIGSRPRLAA